MFGALHLPAVGCARIIPVQPSEQRAGRTVIEHNNKTEWNAILLLTCHGAVPVDVVSGIRMRTDTEAVAAWFTRH